jgi:hypothetical protein
MVRLLLPPEPVNPCTFPQSPASRRCSGFPLVWIDHQTGFIHHHLEVRPVHVDPKLLQAVVLPPFHSSGHRPAKLSGMLQYRGEQPP